VQIISFLHINGRKVCYNPLAFLHSALHYIGKKRHAQQRSPAGGDDVSGMMGVEPSKSTRATRADDTYAHTFSRPFVARMFLCHTFDTIVFIPKLFCKQLRTRVQKYLFFHSRFLIAIAPNVEKFVILIVICDRQRVVLCMQNVLLRCVRKRLARLPIYRYLKKYVYREKKNVTAVILKTVQ